MSAACVHRDGATVTVWGDRWLLNALNLKALGANVEAGRATLTFSRFVGMSDEGFEGGVHGAAWVIAFTARDLLSGRGAA